MYNTMRLSSAFFALTAVMTVARGHETGMESRSLADSSFASSSFGAPSFEADSQGNRDREAPKKGRPSSESGGETETTTQDETGDSSSGRASSESTGNTAVGWTSSETDGSPTNNTDSGVGWTSSENTGHTEPGEGYPTDSNVDFTPSETIGGSTEPGPGYPSNTGTSARPSSETGATEDVSFTETGEGYPSPTSDTEEDVIFTETGEGYPSPTSEGRPSGETNTDTSTGSTGGRPSGESNTDPSSNPGEESSTGGRSSTETDNGTTTTGTTTTTTTGTTTGGRPSVESPHYPSGGGRPATESEHSPMVPSSSPSATPTSKPTDSPTSSPSAAPSKSPSSTPSGTPTLSPTSTPTDTPSASPSEEPTVPPTLSPSGSPTDSPSTVPSPSPSSPPSTSNKADAFFPDEDTEHSPKTPTPAPSSSPSVQHSNVPSSEHSASPSEAPTPAPSSSPSVQRSNAPSAKHSASPSEAPTPAPSSSPSVQRSNAPSAKHSASPSEAPTPAPSSSPSAQHSNVPSAEHSASPSEAPTPAPSSSPSDSPSTIPSFAPSLLPSFSPVKENDDSWRAHIFPADDPTYSQSDMNVCDSFDQANGILSEDWFGTDNTLHVWNGEVQHDKLLLWEWQYATYGAKDYDPADPRVRVHVKNFDPLGASGSLGVALSLGVGDEMDKAPAVVLVSDGSTESGTVYAVCSFASGLGAWGSIVVTMDGDRNALGSSFTLEATMDPESLDTKLIVSDIKNGPNVGNIVVFSCGEFPLPQGTTIGNKAGLGVFGSDENLNISVDDFSHSGCDGSDFADSSFGCTETCSNAAVEGVIMHGYFGSNVCVSFCAPSWLEEIVDDAVDGGYCGECP